MSTNLPTYGADAPPSWACGTTPPARSLGPGAFSLVDIMANSPVYLTNAERDVWWNSILYRASVPFVVSNVRNNPHSAPEPMRVQISNCKRSLLPQLVSDPIQGKDFIVRRAYWVTASTVSTPFILFSGWIDSVQISEERDTGTLAIEVKNGFLRWEQGITRNSFSAACNWKFKSGTPGCQYSGAASVCDRSYDNCLALENTSRFRGFRIIPLIEDRQFWWGRSRSW